MADISGMPGYPVVVPAHPPANNDEATLRVKAQEAMQQCSTCGKRGRRSGHAAVAAERVWVPFTRREYDRYGSLP
jgi:hypothetical protein